MVEYCEFFIPTEETTNRTFALTIFRILFLTGLAIRRNFFADSDNLSSESSLLKDALRKFRSFIEVDFAPPPILSKNNKKCCQICPVWPDD